MKAKAQVHLGVFIREHRPQLLRRWAERARAALPTESLLTEEQLLDSMSLFLEEVAGALAGEDVRLSRDGSPIARDHGGQRQTLQRSIPDLVREYQMLLECVAEAAGAQKVAIPIDQYLALCRYLSAGTAEAVAQFARQEREEAQRRSFEHFAFIAHELRNPLSSVLYAWRAFFTDEPSRPRIAEVIERNLCRLMELVDHSLLEGRLRGVQASGERRELVLVRELLEDVQADSAIDAERRQIRMDIETLEGLRVEGDRRLLRSALTNLVRNGIKFSRPRGTLRIRGRSAEGRILIDVADECGGLPPGKAERLFGAFEQAGRDRSGFGLGLAIAKQAIEHDGGTLRVSDVPGRGCIFTVDLPPAPERAQTG